MYICIYVYIYIYICICVYIYIYIYVYMCGGTALGQWARHFAHMDTHSSSRKSPRSLQRSWHIWWDLNFSEISNNVPNHWFPTTSG